MIQRGSFPAASPLVPPLQYVSGQATTFTQVGEGYAWVPTASQGGIYTLAYPDGPGVSSYLVCEGLGLTVPADAVIVGISATIEGVSMAYENINGGLITDQSILLLLGGNNLGGQIDHARHGHFQGAITYGSQGDLWGIPNLTPAIVNDPTFGLAIRVNDTGQTKSTLPVLAGPVIVNVFYTTARNAQFPGLVIPAPQNAILFDATQVNGGWSSGDGIAIPVQVAQGGGFSGSVLGYSIQYTGLILPGAAGANFAKLGRLYSGVLSGVEAVAGGGWSSFPTDTTMVTELWNGDTDSPFPMSNYGTPTPDVRSMTVSLPQPIPLDPEVPLTIGLWLSPMLGPCGPGAVPQALAGPAVAIVAANYALQLQGGSVIPTL
jgi:hypothetical protein